MSRSSYNCKGMEFNLNARVCQLLTFVVVGFVFAGGFMCSLSA